ncbi:MAG: hypothetical protein ACLVJ6_07285 [Merdibacter sp.]
MNSVTVYQDQIFTRAGNHPEEDGAFYLYLTGEDHLITTGDQIFLAEWDEETSTFTVREKAPAPNVTIRSKTAAGITVEPLTDTDRYGEAEYSMDGNTWQTSNVFTELEAGTEYIVYARYGNDSCSIRCRKHDGDDHERRKSAHCGTGRINRQRRSDAVGDHVIGRLDLER